MQCGMQVAAVAKDFDKSSIRQLYRGVVPPLVTAGAMQSVNFALYEHFKDWSISYLSHRAASSSSSSSSSVSSHFTHYSVDIPISRYLTAVFMAGTISGSISTVLTAPVSLVKVRQQLATRAGVVSCIRQIYQKGGLLKFYRGYPVIFVADSFGRGAYLGTYETTKFLLQKFSPSFVVTNTAKDQYVEPHASPPSSSAGMYSLTHRMVAAAIAGCTSWLVVYPCDVIKSRMQLDINAEK